ncbi:PDZ domain-containing protein [Dyadobacter jejuensis]|uniref:PDZ domain-containing protein n=1 Tax=Dyadobacter jejuensis TaxID=1082580 RepID=A0A316AHF4_9BACT|nr:M28 family peptidase [Dyadobacter jejuensis]PWJ56699.1 PDZ domain-containing protein [Dyadobacter jejuensis]
MKFLLVLIAFFSPLFLNAQGLDSLMLRKHMTYLASDELEGRGTGTLGEIRAANYIAAEMLSYGLKPAGDGHSFFQVFETKIAIESISHRLLGRNVIGFLDNGSPSTIVVGAHYDHLGKGFQGSSLSPNSQNMIHNGADDNASGTAGLLLLAKELASNHAKEQYNYLFIAFSGEELGLIGSKFYCEHPTIPLANTKAMINMDMIGRYRPEKGIIVSGYGTSPSWGELLPKATKSLNMKFTADSSGIGASDHTSFYLKEIPVLQFFTGTHSDYHKVSDNLAGINFPGEITVLRLIENVLLGLDQLPEAPQYTQAGNPHQASQNTSFKVTLGVMPDYSYSGKGLKIDAVTAQRPADKAGIVAGDVIVNLAGQDIGDIYDYMKVLGSHQKGDQVKAMILRNGKSSSVDITF